MNRPGGAWGTARLSLISIVTSIMIVCAHAQQDVTTAAAALRVRAYSEMQTLVDAETIVYIDIGYFVSLESLDDTLNPSPNHDYDYINADGGAPVIDLRTARFLPYRLDLANPYRPWGGPYVTYQPGRTDEFNLYGFDPGTPFDPWDGLYYLFTPAGLVRPPLDIGLDSYADTLGMYYIVSFGPDGRFGGGDDLFSAPFGWPPTSTVLTSVHPRRARLGDTLSLKGYNFGAPGGAVQPILNGEAVTTAGIASWAPGLIQLLTRREDAPGTWTLSLSVSGVPQEPFFDVFMEPPAPPANPACAWRMF